MAQTFKVFLFLRDPDEALAANYDRIKIQQSDDFGVTWEEITDEDSRIVIFPKKYNYNYLVLEAEVKSLFRAVISSSQNLAVDVPQAPQQGIDTSYETMLTVEELKSLYLFGVDLTEDVGLPFPDEMFVHYIRSAISQTEMELDINLMPRFFKEKYDFYRRDYENFCFIQLHEKPVISVERLVLQYPNSSTPIIEFNKEWIHVDNHSGQISVYPSNGVSTTAFVSAGGGYLPFVLGGVDFLPQLIHVDYFAGMNPTELMAQRYYGILKDIIGKRASFGPLNVAGDLIVGAGIASKSISIDGLSRSIGTTSSATNSGYGSRILEYQKEIKESLKAVKKYFGGLRMGVV